MLMMKNWLEQFFGKKYLSFSRSLLCFLAARVTQICANESCCQIPSRFYFFHSDSLSIYVSICISFFFYPYIFLCLYLKIFLFFYPIHFQTMFLFVMCPSIYLCFYFSMCPSTYVSICLCVHLTMFLFCITFCFSSYLSLLLNFYLSVLNYVFSFFLLSIETSASVCYFE